jgi:hypothetical protein
MFGNASKTICASANNFAAHVYLGSTLPALSEAERVEWAPSRVGFGDSPKQSFRTHSTRSLNHQPLVAPKPCEGGSAINVSIAYFPSPS